MTHLVRLYTFDECLETLRGSREGIEECWQAAVEWAFLAVGDHHFKCMICGETAADARYAVVCISDERGWEASMAVICPGCAGKHQRDRLLAACQANAVLHFTPVMGHA